MTTLDNCMTALRLLRARRTVSTEDLIRELEVAERTVRRTIDLLRVRLRLDIVSLPDGGYSLRGKLAPVAAHDPVDRSFMVPGLVLSKSEAYDLLRLLNAVGAIDPGLLFLQSAALRGLLKQFLFEREVGFRGINRKLRFELPQAESTQERANLRALSDALSKDRMVSARVRHAKRPTHLSPQYLVMTIEGWQACLFDQRSGSAERYALADLFEVRLLDQAAVRQPGIDDDMVRTEQALLHGDA